MTFGDVTQRADHQSLSLIGQQLAYLATGATGGNDGSTLETAITEKKHSKLALRVQYLIEDLALLQTADFIDSDQWAETWDQLDEIALQNRVYTQPRAVKNISKDDQPFYEFGVQIGHLARLLCKNSAPEFNQPEIACGFLIGLAGEFMTDVGDNTKPVEDSSTLTDSENLQSSSILSGPSSETLRTIDGVQRSLVDSQEIAPTSFEDFAAAQALEKVGLNSCGPLRDEVWERAAKIDYSSSDTLLEGTAAAIKADERIEQAEELAELIIADLELLADKKYGKTRRPVYASEVFHAVCSQVAPSNAELRNNVREKRRDKPAEQTIFKLRNDLQGEGTDSRHWGEYPLVKEDSGKYKPTAYGKLLGIIATPNSTDRDSDEYLPELEGDDGVLSKNQVLVACYACAFGQPSETHQRIFRAAYLERATK